MKFLNLVFFLKKSLEKHKIFLRSKTPCPATHYVGSEIVYPNFEKNLIDLKLIVTTNHKKMDTDVLSVSFCVTCCFLEGAD